MIAINNNTLLPQFEKKQPKLIFVIFIYLLAVFGLQSFFYILNIVSPSLLKLVMLNQKLYRYGWVTFQLFIIAIAIIYFARKYKLCLFRNNDYDIKDIKKMIIIGFLCSLPLVIYHMYNVIYSIHCMSKLKEFYTQSAMTMEDKKAHLFIIGKLLNSAWASVGYGSDKIGIISGTLSCFIAPIFEEIIFTGFIFNLFLRRLRIPIAIFLTSLIFILPHISKANSIVYLFPVFLIMTTSLISRLYSGSVSSSIISHLIINFVILLPKWFIAIIAFKLGILKW